MKTLPTRVVLAAGIALGLLHALPSAAQTGADSPAFSPRAFIVSDSTRARIEPYRVQLQALAEKLQQDLDAINRDISALGPQGELDQRLLVSPEAIARQRAGLTALRALVQRRSQRVDDYVATTRGVFSTGILRPDVKRELVQAVDGMNASLLAGFKPLQTAQLDSLDAQLALLDLAQRSLGQVALQDGALRFARQQDLDEFPRLQSQLNEARSRIQLAISQPVEVNGQSAQLAVGAALIQR